MLNQAMYFANYTALEPGASAESDNLRNALFSASHQPINDTVMQEILFDLVYPAETLGSIGAQIGRTFGDGYRFVDGTTLNGNDVAKVSSTVTKFIEAMGQEIAGNHEKAMVLLAQLEEQAIANDQISQEDSGWGGRNKTPCQDTLKKLKEIFGL
ncbi:hypothetical protein FACS189475_04180 [Betaproteobacteria bacterium]|nr:hypothetical protein FACS189475_04180 [Betaproteobacteria bacterium]